MTFEVAEGDAIEMMRELPSASIDLVLTDVPYGSTQNPWDTVIPFEPMWEQIWRVCKGPAVFTAMQPFSSALVMSQPKQFKHEWVWEKNKATGHLNAKKAPMRAHELVLVFAQGAVPYHPQMTDGHEPGHAATRRTYTPNYGAQRPTDYGGSTKRYPRSVQRFDIINNDDPEKEHPTQKPVLLFEYLIQTYSSYGAAVLDFCMGSGTTGIACQNTGRDFYGIELNAEYFDLAVRRLCASSPDRPSLPEAVALPPPD